MAIVLPTETWYNWYRERDEQDEGAVGLPFSIRARLPTKTKTIFPNGDCYFFGVRGGLPPRKKEKGPKGHIMKR